jgi:hypothetical protein
MVVVVHCRVVVPETRPPSRDDATTTDDAVDRRRSDPRWGTMGDVCRIRGDAIAVCVCA